MVKNNIIVGFALAIGGLIAYWLWDKYVKKSDQTKNNPVASPYGSVDGK